MKALRAPQKPNPLKHDDAAGKSTMSSTGTATHGGLLMPLERSERKGIGDSGASETVMPKELVADYPLQPSLGSTNGAVYQSASGHPIENEGKRRF